ncbi:MAG: hypothetical protein ACRDY0_00370 [Acidimicrobiales bacterium]
MAQGVGDEAFTDTLGRMAAKQWESDCGVTVHSMLVCAPEHKFFFVLEAPTFESVVAFYRPIKYLGAAEVTVVLPLERA